MAKTLLTEAYLKRVPKPVAGRTEISDVEPGLFLWITPNGTKTWMVIYRLPSGEGRRTRRRKQALGRWPAVGVAEARKQAQAIMDQARQGIDPEVLKAEQEREAAERRAGTFDGVVELYVAAMEKGQLIGGRNRPVTASTAAGRKSLLNRLVVPELGRKALSEIEPKDVARLLAKIERDSGPVDEALKTIRGVFKFALARGLFHGQLPTGGMGRRQPRVKEVRALGDDELRTLWRAAESYGWPFGHAVRLLMLTGQRRNELGAARWREVDWERRLLIIPRERVKNRAGDHEVALSTSALAVLKEAREAYEATGQRSGFIFPSTTGETPINGWSGMRRVMNKKHELSFRWRPHDLRHTFITRCRDGEENADGELIWAAPLDVLQATVNHQITAGVTDIYDHGDIQRRYRLRKRELMDWWAVRLMGVVRKSS